MDKFVATKPVRFDRDYAVGEIIPGEVIDPRSVKRLCDMGRIAPAPKGDIPAAQEAPEPPDDLTCPTCGKTCGNKAALTTHMKSHDAG